MKFNKLFKSNNIRLLATALVSSMRKQLSKIRKHNRGCKSRRQTIKVVASPAPLAEILEAAKPLLEEDDIN